MPTTSQWMRYTFPLYVLLWHFLPLQAQESTPVQQEIGFETTLGFSGPFSAPHSSTNTNLISISARPHYRAAVTYHALFLEGKLHVGIGVGFQHKSYKENFAFDVNGQTEHFFMTHTQRHFILPLEIGYHSQLSGPHHFMVDLLLTPQYLFQRKRYYAEQRLTPFQPTPANNADRLGLDIGLKVGYRLSLSEKLSLQIAVVGTLEPFYSDLFDKTYYTIGLNTGIRYRLNFNRL